MVVTESTQTPHFTGKAYIRVGDSTKEASEEKVQELVENRLSKVREMKKWVGEKISISSKTFSHNKWFTKNWDAELVEVTSFWLKWKDMETDAVNSFCLDDVNLKWNQNKDCLHINHHEQ